MLKAAKSLYSSFQWVYVQRLGEMLGVLVGPIPKLPAIFQPNEVFALEVWSSMVLARDEPELGAFVARGPRCRRGTVSPSAARHRAQEGVRRRPRPPGLHEPRRRCVKLVGMTRGLKPPPETKPSTILRVSVDQMEWRMAGANKETSSKCLSPTACSAQSKVGLRRDGRKTSARCSAEAAGSKKNNALARARMGQASDATCANALSDLE